jgi:hypothetical protein
MSPTCCSVINLRPSIHELIAQCRRGKELVDLENLELFEAQSPGGRAVLRQAWDEFGLDNVAAAVARPTSSSP